MSLIILVHGYLQNSSNFEIMEKQIISKDFLCSSFNYQSEKGVINASNNLEIFLHKKRLEYIKNGIQIERFDIIAHSMGGLVSRYYTSNDKYLQEKNNIRKIIFISTPHNGTP